MDINVLAKGLTELGIKALERIDEISSDGDGDYDDGYEDGRRDQLDILMTKLITPEAWNKAKEEYHESRFGT